MIRHDGDNAQAYAEAGVSADDPYGQILNTVGLRWREGDEAKLRRWLETRLLALCLPSPAAYAELIMSGGAAGRRERELLTIHFSTGETYFFRDQGLFALLADKVLPELIERRAVQRTLRIWSAGCASGEEAYSLAMLLDEMSHRLAGWDVQILGSDINAEAIERARTGIYGQWSFRGFDEVRLARYFRECGHGRQVAEPLRAMVHFSCLDLLHDDFLSIADEPAQFDLILCRNVFIYLSTLAVSRIVAKFTPSLSVGGYLIPGHGELLGCATPSLQVSVLPESVLYGKSGDATACSPSYLRREADENPPPVTNVTRSAHDSGWQCMASPRGRVPPKTVRALEPASRPANATPPDWVSVLNQAWRDADRGATDAARTACLRMLAQEPFDPRPYYLLAQLAQESGALVDAQALLRKVLYLDPRFAVAYLELGELCAQAGDAQGARRMRERALRELRRIPPDTQLPACPQRTAGELLELVQGAPALQAGQKIRMERTIDG